MSGADYDADGTKVDGDTHSTSEAEDTKLPHDYYYPGDDPELLPVVEANELPRETAKPARFVGFDFSRHYNLVFTSDHEFAYITGHIICVVDLRTGEQRHLPGHDDGGIGAIAMSPDMSLMAVAEKSTTTPPNVYVYVYASMKLYRILRKGTTRGYAACEFSPHNSSHMTTLGMAPDYLLSVWDWKNERLMLKCKAYGQDVYSIRWGQFPGMLTSAGVGHIRFWKMATTFTGLKLQGDLGKFGATELSDIVGHVELPDGKVVTGSEYGKLLLWEGVFVKVELMRSDADEPRRVVGNPHTGAVNVVFLQREQRSIVSGGEDGYLRWWPIDDIDEAEADYDNGILEYGIVMSQEVRIPPEGEEYGTQHPANIQHVARNKNDSVWLIQDIRNGAVWVYETKTGACKLLVQTHAGPVTGTLVMQSFPGLVLSCGLDGTLRAYNMSSERDNELFVDRRGDIGITCMTATPAIVDPERRTICCGYADGTIRALSVCRDAFVLMQALKPHNCPVKQLAYSPDGAFLATLGTDNTLFFFEVRSLEDHAIPLGFVQMPCQVNHFSWHSELGKIVLSLEDGTVVELAKPMADSIDNTETYNFSLDYRSVRPELPEPEDSDDEDGEDGEEGEEGEGEGEDAEQSAAERREQRKREKAERKAAEKAEREEGQADEEPSAVSHSVYYQSEAGEEMVFFAGTGEYLGGLWECPMSFAPLNYHAEVPLGEHEPTRLVCSLRKKLPKDTSVTHLSIPPNSRFLQIGFANGRMWLVPLNNMACHTSMDIGDSTHGQIRAVDADADTNMMAVAGSDGSLSFVMVNAEVAADIADAKLRDMEMNPAEIIQQISGSMPQLPDADPETWEMPDSESAGYTLVAKDITNPEFYSIQEDKLKTEEDNTRAQAEQKKRRVRDRISDIRAALVEVREKNGQLTYGKLSSAELTIDQEHISFLRDDMEIQVEDVKVQLAWHVEYHERGLQKLRDYYLARLDFERIEVWGFRSPHRVSTFRCPSMSPELQASLAKLHDLIFAADRESDDEDGGLAETGPNQRNPSGKFSTLIGNKSDIGDGPTGEGGLMGSGSTKQISGAEQRELRRQLRQQRKQQILELEKAKPSDSYEDPQDVEAIAHAEATLGNYMLKTSDAYQVPENQRMNAEKKRRQMFLLEESMHAIKTEFNHRVLALRDFRQQVRTEVDRDLVALREIDEQLGTTTTWVVGLLDDEPGAPPQFPELRFQYTEDDINAFGRQLKEASGEKTAPEKEGADESQEKEPLDDDDEDDDDDDDDEDEAGGSEDEDEDLPPSGVNSRRQSTASQSKGKSKKGAEKAKAAASSAPQQPSVAGRSAVASRRIARLTLRAQLLQEKGSRASTLGKSVLEEAVARLKHDKVQLEEHIRQIIDTFNNAVASIEKEKAKLESDLKNAELKLLVLHDELLTLNELEEKDEALLRKATKCRQDKTSIMHQIKECQDQLGERKAEIEQWHSEEQNLQAEFTEIVGESSPFLGALLKIYKKKVKRSKRKKGLGEDEDFDEDEEEDEEDSDLESDEDEDDMDEDTGPPQGCDVQIYDGVVDLREKRLDMEDALQEIQKAVEELKKTHKKLLDDERRIDKEQKQTDAEIQHFQTDKQRKLNQVEIVFALRLSQVQCLDQEPERLPAQLDHHVVFTREGLAKLMSRITELHQEIREVKASHKQLQRDFRQRKKEKNQKEQNIEELQAKFQDIQMLKFGQIVDLDLIERSAPNKYVQELQEKVVEAEAEHRRRLSEWEKRIEKQKKELAKVTCDNTSLMEQIVSMGYSQMQLDAALNARISNVTVNDTEPLIEQRELERERLKDVLAWQSKQIQMLQAEISLFRKKGGHIYTTVTAPKK